jgi:hypothetical protein
MRKRLKLRAGAYVPTLPFPFLIKINFLLHLLISLLQEIPPDTHSTPTYLYLYIYHSHKIHAWPQKLLKP